MIEALEGVLAGRGWTPAPARSPRLMASCSGDAAPAAPDADPAVTARQPPLALVESGAIPLHALAVASAPTQPRRPLAAARRRSWPGRW